MIEGIQPGAGFAERSAVVLVGELETLKIQPPNIKLLEKSLIWLCSSSKQQSTEKTLEHSLPRWLNGHGVARTQFEQQSKQQHRKPVELVHMTIKDAESFVLPQLAGWWKYGGNKAQRLGHYGA
ncbi:uncharacterized protein PADG_07479 [Paracoccidioides brasiliensis Pb18]|uniref:Uncharacterized protein n=1 Tax=Paracoccidioides brasiliensis (strain Pb18) TaxID=502780 RepID=C1GJP3_PARBD|nr:uncharacterized protein PADG_07479 [Paracoccidioides brasiliensis Pb18]EEH42659.1 hypothetical protein PADG_07479 [Paracoccidioides brasiliensis Pb18]